MEFGCVFVDEDFRFKIETSGETEVIVCQPGVTVDAAMFAAVVGIGAESEAHIGTVVFGEDGTTAVNEKLRQMARSVLIVGFKTGSISRWKGSKRLSVLRALARPLGAAVVVSGTLLRGLLGCCSESVLTTAGRGKPRVATENSVEWPCLSHDDSSPVPRGL